MNATADLDQERMNGRAPLFHTRELQQKGPGAEPVRGLFLDAAPSSVRLAGLVRGKRIWWETTFFDVTPVSYARWAPPPGHEKQEVDIYSGIGPC